MPHTIVEHSFAIAKSQIDLLFLKVNQNIAKNEGNFDISQCKARNVFCQDFLVSDGSLEQDFLHITIKIMQGRSVEIRQNLAENIIKMVGEFLKENNLSKNPIALSVDIVEIEKAIYQKTVVSANS